MNQLTLKNTVLAKNGGAPVAGDVITTNGLVFVNPKIKSGDYKDMGNGMMGATKTFIDPNWVNAEFDIPVQMKKSSALGTAPSIDEMFKMCGLDETIVAATSVAYAPGGTAGTGQIKVYTDGYVRALSGVAGSFKISGKVGEPLSATFSVKGFLASAEATAEANPTVTLDTNTAPVVTKVTVLTVGGTELNADSFDLDSGIQIKELYAMNIAEYYVDDFDPSITVSAVKIKGTDEAAWADFTAGTIRAIIVQVGVAGAMIELSIPYAMLKDVSEADDNGNVKITRTFRAQASAGNDNYTITYK
ncbi:MAG: hypothetical protein Q8M39_11245 [Sulfuricurvum sp.]|nr:hypothetical protein [Sulfuricurvum sp.]